MEKISVKVCLGTTCFVMGSSNLQALTELIPQKYGDKVAVDNLSIRIKPGEICGFIGSNRYLNSAVSLLTAFAAFCAVIGFVDNFSLSLILASVAFAFTHLLLEIIVLRDVKKFVSE